MNDICKLPMSNAGHFVVDAIDRNVVGNGPFFSNGNGRGRHYPRTHGVDNLVGIARIIVNAGPGQQVKYRDGDTTNLRRENLLVKSFGKSKRRDSLLVVPAHSEIEHAAH